MNKIECPECGVIMGAKSYETRHKGSIICYLKVHPKKKELFISQL
jgi:hypothetical protein